MPDGALYCPTCGARASDYTIARSEFSPSHFNSGITATYQPSAAPSEEAPEFRFPAPGQRKRSPGRKGFVLLAIAVLGVFLVGVTVETGTLNSSPSASAVNSPDTPLTGQELYSAFTTNQTQFVSTYLNRTIYIQDTLDNGVSHLFSTGQFYSSVNSGTVVLVWSDPSQVDQLYAGALVLAKCNVGGAHDYGISGPDKPALGLQRCDLISMQSHTTSSAPNAPVANL